ncbi:DUF6417 family protein [Kitasatospora azatica]|uniref:DUF6417 family protein n=1 Tax=Kitasatospora azatica TaxID=58347 RepID=UPI00055E24CD|nr:DUF6417 family protein [Kitasatospora azatica]
MELSKAEVDILRRVLALASELGEFRAEALTAALSRALPIAGTHRWTLQTTEEQMTVIEAAFRLDALAGGSTRSHNRFLRTYRQLGHHKTVGLTSIPDPRHEVPAQADGAPG